MGNLHTLLIHQLQDRYSAAKQQKDVFEKLFSVTENEELRGYLREDIDANKGHLIKLKMMLDEEGECAEGEYCEATGGLVKEALHSLILLKEEKSCVLDIAIVIAIQHINHHDIAGYNGCAILAHQLEKREIELVLLKMLFDEKKTDTNLTAFMKKTITNA